MDNIAKFLFETGMLQNIPRSGLFFLGSGNQSVAEHTHRASIIAYILMLNSSEVVDESKLLKMIIFHDFFESRIGDLNWVNHKYVNVDIKKVLEEISNDYPFSDELVSLIKEFESQQTYESKIANDADQLEFLLTLKTQIDIGNKNAEDWVSSIIDRLHTQTAKDIAIEIFQTNYDEWWFSDKNDKYWSNRDS
ncbi:MAG: HD domain-containing protein [Anaerolineaceae bacterium]|nr:HD domain-containing protein [Anaerolineaceae bacterium]